MFTKNGPRLALALLALVLQSCSNSSVKQIASFPKVPAFPTPIAISSINHAYLEIEVADVNRAAEQAITSTQRYGGYLVNSTFWNAGGRNYATLDLTVPSSYFSALCNELISSGILISEQISDELVHGQVEPPYSTITIQYRSGGVVYLHDPEPGWNPIHTFQRALGVFIAIFGFLVDILIWVGVVIGPFALIGWLLWLALRRIRRHSGAP